jgi:hypothetical protein
VIKAEREVDARPLAEFGQNQGVVTGHRRLEVDGLRDRLLSWAESTSSVRGVAVVGSWARGNAWMDSDVDVIVLTDNPVSFLVGSAWVEPATGQDAPIVRSQAWGPILTERRVRLASDLEVEFGFTTSQWSATDPVDRGTERVVQGGCQVLYDPEGMFRALLTAVAER